MRVLDVDRRSAPDGAVADPHPSRLRDTIVALHEALQSLPLEPGPRVDALFSSLVQACRHLPEQEVAPVLADPVVRALTANLRELCATGEYLLERFWAKRLLDAADPRAELARFPHLDNYQQLISLEAHALLGLGLDRSRTHQIAFLGSGPLPLSALLLAREFRAAIHAVDLSVEATILAAAVVERMAAAPRIRVQHGDARDCSAVASADVVVLAALVGPSPRDKLDVLEAVTQRMRPGAFLVVRSAHGLRTLLYPPLDLDDLDDLLEPLLELHPLNEVVNSLLIARRR